MTKPYTWEEIKKILKVELKKTNHILTYGTIGSCNIDHDIDTIITKKPKSKSSDFFKEVHTLFDNINTYLLNKYSCKLIRTSRFSDEEEIKKLGNFTENDLVFQVLTYVSFSQIEKHWYADLGLNEDLNFILNNSYNLIFGKNSDLYKNDFKSNSYDYLFIRLNDSDRINSNFENEFLIYRMNVLFDFILRKRLNLKFNFIKNKDEVRKTFYEICNKLDELENKRKNLK